MKKTEFSMFFVIGRVIRSAPLLFMGLVLAIGGAIGAALLPPLVLERIVNALTEGSNLALTAAFIYFGALAVSGIFDALKEMLLTMFGQKITHRLRTEMCQKLTRLSPASLNGRDPGALVSRFVGDVDTIESLFTVGVVGMFTDLCKIISIFAVIFVKSKGLFLLMLLVTPILFLFTRVIQKRMLTAQIANRVQVARMNNFVPETIRSIRMIHVFHAESHMEERYDGAVEESFCAVDRVNVYDAIYSPIVMMIRAAVVAAMMVLAVSGGGMQALFGISVGTAVAMIAYVEKVFSPLESIGMEIQTIQSAVAGTKRIMEFMNEEDRLPTDLPAPAATERAPAVSVEGLCFSYDGVTPVLQDLSLQVAAGEQITLAGRTGAGKSTLFKLLLGLYTGQRGEVRVFGTDASRIADSGKRRLFGYVEQSFRPVPGTVGEQITVFDPAISREAMVHAAELSGILDTINGLPRGFDTPYTDSLFSEGQKQLIAIARAAAADPAILLLDEITANLDSGTEARVLTALEKASEGRTVISISHRLYEKTGGRIVTIG